MTKNKKGYKMKGFPLNPYRKASAVGAGDHFVAGMQSNQEEDPTIIEVNPNGEEGNGEGGTPFKMRGFPQNVDDEVNRLDNTEVDMTAGIDIDPEGNVAAYTTTTELDPRRVHFDKWFAEQIAAGNVGTDQSYTNLDGVTELINIKPGGVNWTPPKKTEKTEWTDILAGLDPIPGTPGTPDTPADQVDQLSKGHWRRQIAKGDISKRNIKGDARQNIRGLNKIIKGLDPVNDKDQINKLTKQLEGWKNVKRQPDLFAGRYNVEGLDRDEFFGGIQQPDHWKNVTGTYYQPGRKGVKPNPNAQVTKGTPGVQAIPGVDAGPVSLEGLKSLMEAGKGGDQRAFDLAQSYITKIGGHKGASKWFTDQGIDLTGYDQTGFKMKGFPKHSLRAQAYKKY